MDQRLRVGIAGTGFIGAVHARSALLAGARLAGVAASSPERSEEAARALGAERAYPSAEALAEDGGIDVLHICTPNHLHAPLAHAALAAGKHVICEKPLALGVESAAGLVDAAARAGRALDAGRHVVCEKPLATTVDDAARLAGQAADGTRCAAVPFAYRFYPTVREARERVRSGATGAVHLLHGTYLQDWLLRPDDDNWRVEPELGGASRAFADIGSHWCDLAEFVSGHRITRLTARTTTVLPERARATARKAFASGGGGGDLRAVTTEDAAVIQFETDQGALGAAVISQVSAGRKNRLWLEVDGAQEAVTFDQEHPESLWTGRREATTILRRDPEHLSKPAARLATLPPGHPEGYASCFDRFVEDVYAEIRGGGRADGLPVFEDGLRAATITDAVMASARAQAWVDVPAPGAVDAGRERPGG